MAIFGNNTIGANSNTVNTGIAWITKFTAGANLTLVNMWAYVGGQAGTNAFATLRVFADAAGVPGTQLGTCPGIAIVGAVAQGWITAALASSVSITSGTAYWLSCDDVNNGGSSGITFKWGTLTSDTLATVSSSTNPPTGYSLIGANLAGSIYADDVAPSGVTAHNLMLMGVGT